MTLSHSAEPRPDADDLAPLRRLRVLPRQGRVDVERAERAVAELLEALGADGSQEGLRETPRRVAAAYAELLTP